MNKKLKTEECNTTERANYTITGNGVVHIRASELRKSKKVRDTAKAILENSNKILQN